MSSKSLNCSTVGCILLLFACATAPRVQPRTRAQASPPPGASQGRPITTTDTTGMAAESQARPNLAVVVKDIPEEGVGALDDRVLETEPAEVLIADAFRSRGFPIVDPARVRQNLDIDRLRQILEGDDQTAVTVGLAAEADMVVAGTVQKPREGQEAAGVRLAVRAVNAATGAVLGSTSLDLTGPEGDVALLDQATDSAVAELSSVLLGAWRVRTSVTDVYAENADYQRVQLFRSAILEEARGVDSVKTLSLTGRSAVMEIFSRLPSDELVVQIDRCNTAVPFAVKALSGNRLDIRFLDAPEQCQPDLK
jgi:hypothetical protein